MFSGGNQAKQHSSNYAESFCWRNTAIPSDAKEGNTEILTVVDSPRLATGRPLAAMCNAADSLQIIVFDTCSAEAFLSFDDYELANRAWSRMRAFTDETPARGGVTTATGEGMPFLGQKRVLFAATSAYYNGVDPSPDQANRETSREIDAVATLFNINSVVLAAVHPQREVIRNQQLLLVQKEKFNRLQDELLESSPSYRFSSKGFQSRLFHRILTDASSRP